MRNSQAITSQLISCEPLLEIESSRLKITFLGVKM